MTTAELESIQGAIKEKEALLTKAEGRKEQLMAQLLADFGCNSIEEANVKLQQLGVELQTQQTALDTLGKEIDILVGQGVV